MSREEDLAKGVNRSVRHPGHAHAPGELSTFRQHLHACLTRRAAEDVDSTFREVVATHGNMSTYVKQLTADRRYVGDVY